MFKFINRHHQGIVVGGGATLAADLAKRKQNNKVYMLCRNMDSCEEVRSEIVKKSGNK